MTGGILNYVVANDNFVSDDVGVFSFPCCACLYRHENVSDEPCNTCGHNVNSEPPKDES